MGAGNKSPGFQCDRKHPTSSMKDEQYIQPVPLHFVQGEIYIHLLLTKQASDMIIRGYIKNRKSCIILDLQMTKHSAASWIYQAIVLIITMINANQ
jgi:hypothetical protein